MKSTNPKYYFRSYICMLVLLVFGVVHSEYLNAQIGDGPPTEFTPEDQIVKFDKNSSYPEVISVINELTQEYDKRFIIDRTGYAGAIGLDLPAMNYRDAFNFVLDYLEFELNTTEEYYEIRLPEKATAGPASGTPGQPGQGAAQALASLKTREIRINATFFEGNKRALQEIGVDWSTLTSDVPIEIPNYVTEQGQDQLPAPILGSDQFVNVNSFGAQNVSQNVFNSIVNFGEIGTSSISVQALFSAFEADNLGEVLATPYSIVVDGEQAQLQVGQDFSIKQRDFAGNVTDAFFNTGTILNVTPNIIIEDSIEFVYLDVSVERSSAQPDPVSTIINKQTAATKTLLLDGETTVMAGLYRTEESRVRRGVPLLKDIPLLGYLFGYNSKDIIENELVILIQAEIVKSLPERFADKNRKSKRDILQAAQERNRNDMDYIPPSVETLLPPITEGIETNIDSTMALMPTDEPDTTLVTDNTENTPITDGNVTDPEDLSPEQRELAEELSLPVENPELMVVVPRAFDLEKFLEYKENGVEIPDDTNGEKYYVIGGSFIVRNNAYAFQDRLEEMGYNSRILFNTQSRFHFVAYQGYRNFEAAVSELKKLRNSENQDAWLFIFEGDETEKINGSAQ